MARKATGFMVVHVNNTTPDSEAQFNDWYNKTHLPEVFATGTFYSAVRFINPNQKQGEPKYLAVYETDWADPKAAFKKLMEVTPGLKMWPGLDTVYVKNWTPITGRLEAPAPKAKKAKAKPPKRTAKAVKKGAKKTAARRKAKK